MNRRELFKSFPALMAAPKLFEVESDGQPPQINDPLLGAPICTIFSHDGYCGVRFFGKSAGGKSSYEGNAQETIRHLKKVIEWVEEGAFGFHAAGKPYVIPDQAVEILATYHNGVLYGPVIEGAKKVDDLLSRAWALIGMAKA